MINDSTEMLYPLSKTETAEKCDFCYDSARYLCYDSILDTIVQTCSPTGFDGCKTG